MSQSFCSDCKLDFYYDDTINAKYFGAVANSIGFQAGGLFPICPNCEAKCKTEAAINYERSQVTMKTVWLPVMQKSLKS